MIAYSILKTPLDDLILVANPTHLIGLYFSGCDHVPANRSEWKLDPRHAILQKAADQLHGYLKGTRTSFSLPLHFAGTEFQERVWREIDRIPFGQTITYSDLAKKVGAPNAVRAAGTATGKNRLGIIIPCHRVVGKNGSKGGYAGGLERKHHLLQLEQKRRQPVER
jgi:methylated-DNA-[protein]-cysteine S-methyltransferase